MVVYRNKGVGSTGPLTKVETTMIAVVGYEGTRGSNPISWGAAAIKDGEWLVNSVTGLKVPFPTEPFPSVVFFKEPLEVEGTPPKYVLEVHTNSDTRKLLPKSEMVSSSRVLSPYRIFFFSSYDQVRAALSELTDRLVVRVLSPHLKQKRRNELIQLGLTLSPNHPKMLATRLAFAPELKKKALLQISEVLLKSEADRLLFWNWHRALTTFEE